MPFFPLTPDCLHLLPYGLRADLPRGRQLVSVPWLAAQLGRQASVPGWTLWEVGCDGLEAYWGGHIPGARYWDTRQFEQLPFWNALPLPAMQQLLRHAGIGPQSTVILYGRNTLAAARLAQLMLTAGVRDVRLLDGGLPCWCKAGYSLAQGPQPVAADSFDSLDSCDSDSDSDSAAQALGFAARPDYLIDTAQARALLAQADAALVSNRTRAEYLGETSGYPYIEARGEIAGALWGHAGSDGDVNSMGSLQDADGRMKPAAEIAALWREAGIGPEMQIAFYCGTGWRASLAFFYAWLMGWPRISVYDGGWFEWSADPANPVG